MADTAAGKDYFKAPFSFWEKVPYGNSGKPEYFTKNLGRKLRAENWPDTLKDQIFKIHPFKWGMDYYSTNLPNSDLMTVTVVNIPSHSTHYLELPGLNENEQGTKTFFGWQEGMTEMLGYYFYDSKSQELISVQDFAKKKTGKRVRFFLYSDELEGKLSARVTKLTDKQQGDEYYAVCIANPSNLSDVLGLIHEIGHIELMEKSPSREDELTTRGNFKVDLERWEKKRQEIIQDPLTRRQDEDLLTEMLESFSQSFLKSDTYGKKMGAEMAYELDTWIVTLFLLDELGIRKVFERKPKELLEYIYSTIKSRMNKRTETNTPKVL